MGFSAHKTHLFNFFLSELLQIISMIRQQCNCEWQFSQHRAPFFDLEVLIGNISISVLRISLEQGQLLKCAALGFVTEVEIQFHSLSKQDPPCLISTLHLNKLFMYHVVSST